MKDEKFFEAMADIDEKYIIEARNGKIKKIHPAWTRWVAMAACLCIVIAGAVAVFGNESSQSSEAASDMDMDDHPIVGEEYYDEAVCAVTVFYNGKEYISLSSPEEYKEAGLPDTITEDLAGQHVAYLTYGGESGYDYIETDEATDIELFTCTAGLTKEIFILKDADAFFPIVEFDQ